MIANRPERAPQTVRFTAVDRPRQVSANIADQIRSHIDNGTLAIGQRLPTEAELARDFGVSRPSVREALAALQFVGLVESRRGFGTVVTSQSAELETRHRTGRPGTDRPPLQSVGQALDLIETRLILEPAALAAAAADPDLDALDRAGDLIDGMNAAVDDPALHASTDISVHHALLDICRNELLRESARDLLGMVLDPMLLPVRDHAWATHDRPHHWADQHGQVRAAVLARDADAARSASQAHLISVVLELGDVLKDRRDDDMSGLALATRVGRIVSLHGHHPGNLTSAADLFENTPSHDQQERRHDDLD